MNLELLKYSAGYLPYKLKIKTNNLIREMVCDRNIGDEDEFNLKVPIFNVINGIGHKLILRTLSDLTKEIEHNEEKFVPIDVLNKTFRPNSKDLAPYGYNGKLEIDIETENYSQTIDLMDGFYIAQNLLEWHFDIYGLI